MVGDRRAASFGAWRDVDLSSVWTHYVDAVAGAGGAPVVFPVAECYRRDAGARARLRRRAAAHRWSRPRRRTATAPQPTRRNEPGDPLRDRVELALASAALERETCRCSASAAACSCSTSSSAAASSSTSPTPTRLHRGEPGTFVDHPIEVEPGTRLAVDPRREPGAGSLPPPPGRRPARAASWSSPHARPTGWSRPSRPPTATSASRSSGTRRRTSPVADWRCTRRSSRPPDGMPR